MTRIALVDYGAGNIGSLLRGLKAACDVDVLVADRPLELEGVAGIVIPGVGAFANGMARIREHGWLEAIVHHAAKGGFVLGVCAGMQFLASVGDEGGPSQGLDLVPGDVVSLESLGCGERLPHVGWNSVETNDHALFAGIPTGTDFYFSHRYTLAACDKTSVVATFTYGVQGVAAVARGNVHGIQFHPEKSSFAGARVLENAMKLATA